MIFPVNASGPGVLPPEPLIGVQVPLERPVNSNGDNTRCRWRHAMTGRLTRADERAMAKLLAGHDQRQVDDLMAAVARYEVVVTEARARLTRRPPLVSERYFLGGYCAAMETIMETIADMAAAGPRDVLLAVNDVAAAARELHYDGGVPESWAGSAA